MDERSVNNLLPRLQRWYAAQCDGEWEHHHGISIETLDNPGWLVKVDLTGTSLRHEPYHPVRDNTDEAGCPQGLEWLSCCVEDGVWQGAGDANQLARILEEFLAWAERQ